MIMLKLSQLHPAGIYARKRLIPAEHHLNDHKYNTKIE